VRLWHSLRTAVNLAERVDQLEAEYSELLTEWLDKKDSIERLLKRLAIRESRAGDGERSVLAPVEAAAASGPPGSLDKAALRLYARQRGLLK